MLKSILLFVFLIVPAGVGLASAPSGASPVTSLDGFAVFQTRCTSCHGNPDVRRAPTPEQLRNYSPETIYAALTSGPMKSMGDTLSELERRQVSEALAGRRFGTDQQTPTASKANACRFKEAMADPASQPQWNGWGANLSNTRYQPAAQAKLAVGQVAKLKLKWAFGLPNATSSYSQPTVVSGRVFVGSDSGYIYSLDARTGCTHWTFKSRAGVRNALVVGAISGLTGVRYAVFYGDLKGNEYALDAESGRLLWEHKVDAHYTAMLTASPALFQGRLYVPVSSWEEYAAASVTYPCCSSVGSVVALDANTGGEIWKTYAIAERPKPSRVNAAGVQLFAPAGASVWNTPTVDPKRGAIYFGTGDGTTYPAAPTTDAVVALDMPSGQIRWSYQVVKDDSFVGGCWGETQSDNCPKKLGPDWDIPCPPILMGMDGKDVLIVATKPGDILALDPDNEGQPIWRSHVRGEGAAPSIVTGTAADENNLGGVLWGGAAFDETAVFGLQGQGGIAATNLTNGGQRWFRQLHPPVERVSNTAAATAIPGVIFVGGSDGMLTALDAATSQVLWQFATNRSFRGVNGIKTHGGSISSAGAIVVDGRVFVGSGYGLTGNLPGNAVLAFE